MFQLRPSGARLLEEQGEGGVITVAGKDPSAITGGGGGAVRAAMWASNSARASEGDGFCFAVWRECLPSSMDLMSLTPEPGSGVWFIAGAQVSMLQPEDCFRDKLGDSVRRWRGMAVIGLGQFMFLTPEPGSGVWFIAGAQVSVLRPEY